MDQPVFTIIIPTFNSGKTIRQTLDSLLGQTFVRFEVLIMDGNSKDDTLGITKEYVEKDKRISFVSEKDAGIYDAMNKGIDRAAGEWLYFLGSDDRLHDKTVLEKVYAETRKGNYDVLYGHIISDKDGRYGGPVTMNELIKKNISHQGMFFKKKVLIELGYYNLAYKTHADWDFNLRLFEQRNANIQYIDVTVADYASGGLSSVHETEFLHKVILPLRLQQLRGENKRGLQSISWFDEWWRFIRNAHIKKTDELKTLAGNDKVPFPLAMIVEAQQGLSQSTLANGFSSKFLMSVTYSRYLFFKILNKI